MTETLRLTLADPDEAVREQKLAAPWRDVLKDTRLRNSLGLWTGWRVTDRYAQPVTVRDLVAIPDHALLGLRRFGRKTLGKLRGELQVYLGGCP